jgi:hypothetical protein
MPSIFPNSNDINNKCQIIKKETLKNPRKQYNNLLTNRIFFSINDSPTFFSENIDISTKMLGITKERQLNPKFC